MKITMMLLLFATFFASGRCNQADSSRVPNSAGYGEFKRGSDGTATATGIVLENNHGCLVDASCYLQLHIGNRSVRVIYHPGEGESHVSKPAYKQGAAVTKGARVKVYGQYRKQGDLDIIETFSSDKFYIQVLSD